LFGIAVGASQAADEAVGPDSAQLSARVYLRVRLYVNAKVRESVVSIAPSAGEGLVKVIAGSFGFPAAEPDAVTRPTSTDATTVARSNVRTRWRIPLPSRPGGGPQCPARS
jgi:hypothetical protein